jgi:hypothetical protein
VPVLGLDTRNESRVLDDDVGVFIYPIWHVDAFEMEVVDHTGASSAPFMIVVNFFATVGVFFTFQGHLMGSDPLRQRPDIPRENLLDQILEFIRWGIEWVVLLKQITNGMWFVS